MHDDSNNANGIKFNSSNAVDIDLDNSATSQVVGLISDTTFGVSATWHHILASWNVDGQNCQLYINGVEDAAAGGTCGSSTTVDWTPTSAHTFAAHYLDILRFNGCLSEFYLNTTEFLDFAVEANRDLFRTSGGAPVNLGSDGSTPTGNQPLNYFPNSASTVGTNAGSSGNHGITGSFDDCSTSPSD